jgi:hypothetical protein
MNRTLILIINGVVFVGLMILCFQLQSLRKALAAAEGRNENLANQITEIQDALAELKAAPNGSNEIESLRNEISAFRHKTETAPRNQAPPAELPSAPPLVYPDSIRRSEYQFAGFQTTAAAVESKLWAITHLDVDTFLASSDPRSSEFENFQRIFNEMPERRMPGGFKNGAMYNATGFRIIEDIAISEEERHLKVFLEGKDTFIRPILKQVNGEWKWSGQKLE